MACEIIPIERAGFAKACSGKCNGIGCANALPRVWVLAACEGMISLFEKTGEGVLVLVPQEENPVAASLEAFRQYIGDAAKRGAFKQLVVIGAASDISWVRLSLPEEIFGMIIAEICYPLMPVWFGKTPELVRLTKALEHVLAA